ncbi:Crp/Fnr family transcriptional regulator [Halovulum dunhuangense]|uniref:Crp/Fnr family transcriptional regulator n=1 Tax=Halovulum dunhuangense TaxID=1505036 RepID=A0A849KTT7_9RHOB|nr:Crp/Fnr family transcriptional regulator [Halovulum dunhuangense]NNU78951.1 Crp/Fnr family transcriptional regulator [Halovulum dunhuangense]
MPISGRPAGDPQACENCPIRHRAVCAHCESDELEVLEGMKSYKTYAPGEPVVWAGDPMPHVASVVNGVASISRTMEDGRRQMVGLLLPSDFLGRPGRSQAAFDVTAATELTVCRFERKPFEKLLETTPSISRRLLEMTLDELDAAREWMVLLGRKTAREKIASLLVILARREISLRPGVVPGRLSFDLMITREAMADYLGLTIETVSRQITALRKDGVIELGTKRQITVPDFSRLMDEAGDDSDGDHIA